MKITSFRGLFVFLSNFFYVNVEFDGEIYPSVEHAYQAAKTLDLNEREKIRNAKTAKEAKALGYKITLRKDWNDVKVEIMLGLLRQKFKKGTHLSEMLLLTNDAEIIEGNFWGDTFWGVDSTKGGENMLGKLLMQVRQEVREKMN